MRLPAPLDRLDSNTIRCVTLLAGASLFLQDAPTRGLCFLEHGSLELRRLTFSGEAVVLHRVMPGETFAEASLFVSRYHCEAIAITESAVLELDRKAVLSCFASDADFATALAARFASQIQTYRRRLEIMAIRSAEERVHAALLEGMLTGSIKSLAGEIGLAHEVVYRALAKLVKNKRIEKSAHGEYQPLPIDA